MNSIFFFFRHLKNAEYSRKHRGFLAVISLNLCLLVSVPALAAVAPTLGVVDQFGVLGGSGVTAAGPAGTVVGGDVGSSPTPSITGFPPALVNPPSMLHTTNDAVVQQAQVDATTAVGELNPQACDQDLTGQDLGLVGPLIPGVYCFTSTAGLTGTLTLDGQGDPNAVFVFRTGSTLTTASASLITVTNGADACNVFWQVGSSATLGSGSTFLGSIFADQSVTLGTTASLTGRAIAQNGAVTLEGTNTIEGCSTSQISIVKNTVGGDDSFDFSSTTLTPGAFNITTAGNTGSQNFGPLVPGSYDVTETVPSGWTLTSATCDNGDIPGDITLDGGENITCTFTNTENNLVGSITVEKQTLPDGSSQAFMFNGDLAGSITDGNNITMAVSPGTYTSTETLPGSWNLSSIVCDDGASATPSIVNVGTATATFNVDQGEAVRCVFTNTLEAQAVPAFSRNGMLILMVLMGFGTIYYMRRKRI